MAIVELIFVAFLLSIIHIVQHFRKTMSYWKVRGVKHIPPLPVVGNMLRAFKFDRHFFHVYNKMYHAFPEERMVGMYEFTTATLILRDPELIKTVLVSEFSTFPDRGPIMFNPGCILYWSIFSLGGNKWRAIRSKLLTPFTTGRLKLILPSVTRSCLEFLESGPKELTLDILRQLTLRIFSQTMFGIDIKSEEAEFLENYRGMLSVSKSKVVQQVGLTFFPRFSDFMSFKFMPIHLEKYFRSFLNAILNKKMDDSSWRDDAITILNEMRKRGKVHFHDKEKDMEELFDFNDELAQAQAFLLLFAALEPSSITLMHLAYDLAQSPDSQNKARQEIKALLQKYGGYSWECVKEMKYLNCCLKDPKKYKPERFLDEKIHQFIYLPFSDGPRICLGSRFFIMEALTLFAHILEKFELSISKEMKLPLKYEPITVFLTPKINNPVIIHLKKIN
ncbi:unnamed protein product [Nezara viridula]|uniref:Cytochrome P450 n=1 Tax=Nezara viridula TaxID=85310 RepID=A0A9P0H818_NEZVI|nr:unnamed protein product [Nezara viridula]